MRFRCYFVFFFRCTANGNCLYNSCSLLLNGTEDLCDILRALVSLELCLNSDYYEKHPYILGKKSSILKKEGYIFGMAFSHKATERLNTSLKYKILKQASLNISNRQWSPLLCLLALSEVLSQKIVIIFPKTKNIDEYEMYNGVIHPQRCSTATNCELKIMFTTTTPTQNTDQPFKTNHYVLLLETAQSQTGLSEISNILEY